MPKFHDQALSDSRGGIVVFILKYDLKLCKEQLLGMKDISIAEVWAAITDMVEFRLMVVDSFLLGGWSLPYWRRVCVPQVKSTFGLD